MPIVKRRFGRSMRVKTWKVLDYGLVPEGSRTIPYTCSCGHEAELPVKGQVIAILGDGDGGDGGVVFDNDGPYALPTKIQCRRCGRVRVKNDVR